LKQGDKVPADSRLISFTTSRFLVDQSMVTGESEPKNKITEPV